MKISPLKNKYWRVGYYFPKTATEHHLCPLCSNIALKHVHLKYNHLRMFYMYYECQCCGEEFVKNWNSQNILRQLP